MGVEFGKAEDMPVDPRVIRLSAEATIREAIDALVELITNADDSYSDDLSEWSGGEIELVVVRDKSGLAQQLKVVDHAGGMDRVTLEGALTFGGAGRATTTKQRVRGYFGRGLKESIVALGRGEVRTIKGGQAHLAEVFLDSSVAKRRLSRPIPLDSLPTGWAIQSQGTEVFVACEPRAEGRRKIAVPSDLAKLIAGHYALRNIAARRKLTIVATWIDRRGNKHIEQRFEVIPNEPNGEFVGTFPVAHGALLDLYESEDPMEVVDGSPYTQAGFTIQTEAIPLDRKVFLPGHSGARFFFGSVRCDAIADLLRQDQASFLRADRGGLDWRTAFCRQIQESTEAVLRPHFDRRAQRPGQSDEKESDLRKRNVELAKRLNRIARDLQLDLVGEGAGDDPGPKEVTEFVLRPAFLYIRPGGERTLSAYVPQALYLQASIRKLPLSAEFALEGSRSVRLRESSIKLKEQILKAGSGAETRFYRCVATLSADQRAPLGSHARVTCRFGGQTATSDCIVRELGKKREANEPGQSRRGGLFSEIIFDPEPNPTQPVFFDRRTGRLYINIAFPGTKGRIAADGRGLDHEPGTTLCCQLVAEGLCRTVIASQIESGAPTHVDTFSGSFNEYDSLRRRCIDSVRAAVVELYGS